MTEKQQNQYNVFGFGGPTDSTHDRSTRTLGKHAKPFHHRYGLPNSYVSLHTIDQSMSGFGNPFFNSDEPWCI